MRAISLFVLLILIIIATAQEAGKGGSPCQSDSDCQLFYECKGNGNKGCVHKSLFPNPTARELVGIFLSIIINAFTNASGVGAGSLVAPFLMLFNNFSPNEAIVMTYPIIFGGGIGTTLNFIFKRNPETKGPMINYNNVILSAPAFQVGAPIGVLLNRILAPLMMNILLVLMLGFLAIMLIRKSCQHYFREKKQLRAAKQQEQKATQPHDTATTIQDNKAQISQELGQKEKKDEDLEINHIKESEVSQLDAIDLVVQKARRPVLRSHSTRIELSSSLGDFLRRSHSFIDRKTPQKREEKKEEDKGEDDIPKEKKEDDMPKEKKEDKNEEKEKETKETKETRETIQTVQASENKGQTDLEVDAINIKIEKWRKKERRLFPIEKILLIFLLLATTTILNLFFGTKKVKSILGVDYCSGEYWGIFVALIAVHCLYFGGASWLILKWRRAKIEIGWDFTRELQLCKRRLLALFLIGVLGGLLSGLLAAGGALVSWLLLLKMGVSPLLLLASTSLLINTSQFTTVLMACLEGNYAGGDLAFYICTAAFFSFMITRIVRFLVKRRRRQSYIIGNLGIILSISFVINFALLFIQLSKNRDYVLRFKSPC